MGIGAASLHMFGSVGITLANFDSVAMVTTHQSANLAVIDRRLSFTRKFAEICQRLFLYFCSLPLALEV